MADQSRGVRVNASALLLDFDGPVTRLLPPPANKDAADAARLAFRGSGASLPAELDDVADHLAVLRAAQYAGPATLRAVADVCRSAEVAAALVSQPTAGVAGLLHSAASAGVRVVVVTNNAPEAALAFLDRHGLRDLVQAVVGRDPERPDLMKPDPALIDEATALLDVDPASAVLIGDSVTDVLAGHARGVRVIGYAKHARRGRELAEAGADKVTAELGAIRVALLD